MIISGWKNKWDRLSRRSQLAQVPSLAYPNYRYLVLGAYYAETLAEGIHAAAPKTSQAYITQLNAQSIIFIKAENSEFVSCHFWV